MNVKQRSYCVAIVPCCAIHGLNGFLYILRNPQTGLPQTRLPLWKATRHKPEFALKYLGQLWRHPKKSYRVIETISVRTCLVWTPSLTVDLRVYIHTHIESCAHIVDLYSTVPQPNIVLFKSAITERNSQRIQGETGKPMEEGRRGQKRCSLIIVNNSHCQVHG